MIVTVARVSDLDRFLEVFATKGKPKRREHGCRGARVFLDPEDQSRVWAVFDWDEDDYAGFLADPEIPAIARELALVAPPVHAVAVAEHES